MMAGVNSWPSRVALAAGRATFAQPATVESACGVSAVTVNYIERATVLAVLALTAAT